MRRLFVFLIVSQLVSCGQSDSKSFVVPKIESQPEIDGIKEELWKSSNNYKMSYIFSGEAHFEGEKDISGDFNILYDSVNMYFFFEIKDNIKYTHDIPNNKFDNRNWKSDDYDKVSILFDLNKDRRIDYKNLEGDCEIGFNYNINKIFTKNISDIEGIKFKQRDELDGYNLEIQLSWKTLNIVPIKNKKIGFCVRVCDNDSSFCTPKYMDMLGGQETVMVWPGLNYFENYYKGIGLFKFE